VFQVTTTFSGPAGTPWMNRLYFDSITGQLAQDAADAVGAFWGACDALIRNDVTWTTGTNVETLDEVSGALVGLNTVTASTGTGADSTTDMATVLQALVQWRTGVIVGDRELRGRTFIPGLTQNVNNGGVLTGAAQTAFAAAAAALIADADADFGIWHRPVNEANGAFHEAVTGSVPLRFSVLRSRRD